MKTGNQDLVRVLKNGGVAVALTDTKNYFGDQVDLYIEGIAISSFPSKVLRLHPDAFVTVVRG